MTENYDHEQGIINLFMQLNGIKTMLRHFDNQIAEGNDEHNWGQSTLFMVEEFERMLETALEVVPQILAIKAANTTAHSVARRR